MPFRFGLLGAGAVADTHVQAMRLVPDVEVMAVADVDVGRARALARSRDIPQVYPSHEDLLAHAPVDAVSVVVPHHLHLPLVLAAARAGKHVLVEKAIAHTVGAADEMISECAAQGVTLGGIFQNRFSPAAQTLCRTVQSGLLGRPFLASVTVKVSRSAGYFERAPWRARRAEAGGGVLMINAIHMLDLLQWILGMPRRVLGRTATAVHPVEVEDLAAGILEFGGGALGVLQATTAALPEVPSELEIQGEHGTATVFESRGHLGFWGDTRDRPTPLPERWALYAAGYHEQDPTVPTHASPEPHAEQIRDFVAAVREGRAPLVDGAEARKALLIVDALYRSAESGRWVDVLPSER